MSWACDDGEEDVDDAAMRGPWLYSKETIVRVGARVLVLCTGLDSTTYFFTVQHALRGRKKRPILAFSDFSTNAAIKKNL
jgi:hypothetical protein